LDVTRHLPEIQYEFRAGIHVVLNIWQMTRACQLTDGNQYLPQNLYLVATFAEVARSIMNLMIV
jgi:hypothetical protein